jgi:ribosome-binding ATPase YchF (GTP1/OBG family)
MYASRVLWSKCRWFSPVSSTNKTDHHDITEILLKMALSTIKPTLIVCNTVEIESGTPCFIQ